MAWHGWFIHDLFFYSWFNHYKQFIHVRFNWVAILYLNQFRVHLFDFIWMFIDSDSFIQDSFMGESHKINSWLIDSFLQDSYHDTFKIESIVIHSFMVDWFLIHSSFIFIQVLLSLFCIIFGEWIFEWINGHRNHLGMVLFHDWFTH